VREGRRYGLSTGRQSCNEQYKHRQRGKKSHQGICSTSVRFAGDRVDLSNVPAGELHHGCCALVGSVGSNQYLDPRRLRLGEGSRKIRNLVARRLVAVWIRKMTIR